MSEKKARVDRKLAVVAEEADHKAVAEDMARSISKMYEDRDRKALAAKEHLVQQLSVTSDKYRTANGVMSALETVRLVLGNGSPDIFKDIAMAKGVAINLAHKAQEMADKAGQLDPDDMDQLCDGFYEKDFASLDGSVTDMVIELMLLQLCQNVGPSAEDVVDFIRNADTEIEKARENLRTYCTENDINFNELCGPHDNCPDCLCMDCEKDCKDGRKIEEGQSAYDVCERFEKIEG